MTSPWKPSIRDHSDTTPKRASQSWHDWIKIRWVSVHNNTLSLCTQTCFLYPTKLRGSRDKRLLTTRTSKILTWKYVFILIVKMTCTREHRRQSYLTVIVILKRTVSRILSKFSQQELPPNWVNHKYSHKTLRDRVFKKTQQIHK